MIFQYYHIYYDSSIQFIIKNDIWFGENVTVMPGIIIRNIVVQWWFWYDEKILENAQYVTEDIDAFCEKFYPDAHKEFLEMVAKRKIEKDTYFAFVDYYEGYSTYPLIIEDFIHNFHNDSQKKLILFIQDDCEEPVIREDVYNCLKTMISELNEDDNVLCQIQLTRGYDDAAKEIFLNCTHYITSRTYRTVYYTCLADMLNIDIIHGVDYPIRF